MRMWSCLAMLIAAGAAIRTQDAPRADWIDPDTGHRVVRLTSDDGGSTLYFHDNAFSPQGDKVMFYTPRGIAVVEVSAIGRGASAELVVPGRRGGYFARRTREIYYSAGRGGPVMAIDVDTKRAREVRYARGLVNADETLAVVKNGSAADPEGRYPRPTARPAIPQLQRMFPGKRLDELTADQQYAVAKEDRLAPRALNPSLQSFVFTKLRTGESHETGFQYGDLNHLQFNPVDPDLLLYCHEGTWHEVDRTWTIRADGTQMRLMHKRTMDMEINGHEWWSWNGRTVWFDLQTPRSQDFWIAGVEMATGREIRYHLQRSWWGVHFNSSRDDTLFASDGGDPSQVAYATDGMWINLLRVQKDGTVSREPLVNMSKHNYVTGRGGIEPNVHITPDKKWVVFTGNFDGGRPHVYAVEIEKSSRAGTPEVRTVPAAPRKFDFGTGLAGAGYVRVLPSTTYSDATGYGFETGADLNGGRFFSVAVPEGNYRVTATLGDARAPASTTLYAELRRLMVERADTAPGQYVTRDFIVNVRRPTIPGGSAVVLKDRERTTEAWAWDDRLTIEVNGSHPAVAALQIEKIELPTVYLLGDSTVCDQPREPYSSWGQMLTRFLRPEVAVANHAESGESLAGAVAAHRVEKIWSEMKRGDYLVVQFGHNDMKSRAPNALETYTAGMKSLVDETRRRGGVPVLVTSVSRRTFDPAGVRIVDSFEGYTQAVRRVASEQAVPLVDLQECSARFYEALGPEGSRLAFATMTEGTHHNDYGSYEIAKCVLMGLKQAGVDLAKSISDDFRPFDPASPDPVEGFAIAKSSLAAAAPPPGR